jgi:hypothetical protein
MTINYRWLIAGAVIAAALLAVWAVLAAALLTVWAGLSARSPEAPSPTIHAYLMPALMPAHGAVAPWAHKPRPVPLGPTIHLLPMIHKPYPGGPPPKPPPR